MRCLSAGLTYVVAACLIALLLGSLAGGLNYDVSVVALLVGAIAATAAYLTMRSRDAVTHNVRTELKYQSVWLWLTGAMFAVFAVRSFGWLFYYQGQDILVQSPNNLGDLGLHITYIKTFANGVRLWPDSPLFVFSRLRYPAGMDLFNGLLTKVGFDLRHQLAATGLIASMATFYAFYRWSGAFGIAGFLFNGGVAGYQYLTTWQFLDYQGPSDIAWKNIPLSMFVTQRGLLYAIPAGLVLLWHWRARYGDDEGQGGEPLPPWVAYLLYATMPLFHVHTFLALSIVLAVIFSSRPTSRASILRLVAVAFVPATFFVWLITDHLHAGSMIGWQPGWTQNVGDFAKPFLAFWFINFGAFLPLAITLAWSMARREWIKARSRRFFLSIDSAYLIAAILIFVVALFVKTAPWEWDNTKILIWAYFITLPLLWRYLIKPWPLPARAAACLILFFSGFVSLFGGLAAGRPGFQFARRAEIDVVAAAVGRLPMEARFAAFPTYNHPLLLNGRKLVLGYPGHLWTQGINYAEVAAKLQSLMLGQGDWMKTARELHVRYLFWGSQEMANYQASSRPWEKALPCVAKTPWASIYDFGQTPSN